MSSSWIRIRPVGRRSRAAFRQPASPRLKPSPPATPPAPLPSCRRARSCSTRSCAISPASRSAATIRESPDAKDVPILVLSRSSTSDLDRILALEAGADDVVVRPFFPRELALRVRSRPAPQRRRAPGSAREPRRSSTARSRLDELRRSVHANGQAGRPDRIEFALLALLIRASPSHVPSPARRSWPSSGPEDRRPDPARGRHPREGNSAKARRRGLDRGKRPRGRATGWRACRRTIPSFAGNSA